MVGHMLEASPGGKDERPDWMTQARGSEMLRIAITVIGVLLVASHMYGADKPVPDVLKGAIDPFIPGVERGKFLKAAGVDSELDVNEFKVNADLKDGFVRPFDKWSNLILFDKNKDKQIDWFEANQYRKAVRAAVLAVYDKDRNRKLAGAERESANKDLAAGKLPRIFGPNQSAARASDLPNPATPLPDGKQPSPDKNDKKDQKAPKDQKRGDLKYDINGDGVVNDQDLALLDADLQKLDLKDSKITDAGLFHLRGMTQLEELKIENAQVTDAGLAHLKGLVNLKELELKETQISDAGLVHLGDMTQLEVLKIKNAQVTDAGLAHLKGLVNLRKLDLEATQITDAGLVHLRGMTKLEDLKIKNTQVTDAAIEHLKALKSLKKLEVRDTNMSQAAIDELQEALPNAHIKGASKGKGKKKDK